MCEREGLFETETSLVKTNLIYYTTNFINKFMDQRPLLAKAMSTFRPINISYSTSFIN